MVSNIPYRSTKAISVRQRHSFYVPVLFILGAAIVWIYPHILLWVLATFYTASGPVEFLVLKTFHLGHRAPGALRKTLGDMKRRHGDE